MKAILRLARLCARRPGPRPLRRRLRTALAAFPTIALALASGAMAQFDPPTDPFPASKPRPKVGLVLSGGGARGITHIGVLRMLEQMRVPVDFVAGTSMGAIVGGAYAAGVPLEEMEKTVLQSDWENMFSDQPPREELPIRKKQEDRRALTWIELGFNRGEFSLPKGATPGMRIEALFRQLTERARGIDDFDRLPIPFRAVATDLVTGEMVVFDRGVLAQAMRASMSIPGAFAPMEIDGRLLIDGGMVRNLPVDIVRRMGAEVVIAVNIGTPLMKRESLGSVIGVSLQMINILTEQNVRASLAELTSSDVLINPDLGDITAGSFEQGAEAIRLGTAAALEKRESLERLSLPPAEYVAHLAARARPPATAPTLDYVEFKGLERVNPEVLARSMRTKPGDTLDEGRLARDLELIYGRGDFERLTPALTRKGTLRGLTVEAIEKSWGPGYVRFGLGLESDLQGDAWFGALASYTLTWLNPLGAEWRTDVELGRRTRFSTEFYQPLQPSGFSFVMPRAEWRRDRRAVYLDGGRERVAEYDFTNPNAGIDAGLHLADAAELRVGLEWGKLWASRVVGSPELPDFSANRSGVRLGLNVDRLDNLNFPRHGYALTLAAFASLKTLGSESDYTRAVGDGGLAWTRGPFSFSGGLRLGTRIGSDPLPYYDWFTLGGFANLSGYRRDQIAGEYLGFGRVLAFYRLAALPAPLGTGIFAGGSIEAGNAWLRRSDFSLNDLRYAGSAFVGADTFLGPLYFAYGVGSGGNRSFYLFLGRP